MILISYFLVASKNIVSDNLALFSRSRVRRTEIIKILIKFWKRYDEFIFSLGTDGMVLRVSRGRCVKCIKFQNIRRMFSVRLWNYYFCEHSTSFENIFQLDIVIIWQKKIGLWHSQPIVSVVKLFVMLSIFGLFFSRERMVILTSSGKVKSCFWKKWKIKINNTSRTVPCQMSISEEGSIAIGLVSIPLGSLIHSVFILIPSIKIIRRINFVFVLL